MSQEKPAVKAFAVTPSDSVFLKPACRSLYIGTGGGISVEMLEGEIKTVVFPDIPSGSILSIQVTRVNETGTTASGIVALW